MNTFKTLALRIAAITAAFALAFTFMVGSSNEADAAAQPLTAGAGITAVMIATSVPALGVIGTTGTLNGGGSQAAVLVTEPIEFTFTAGTTLNTANIVAADFTAIQGLGAASGGTAGVAGTLCGTTTAVAGTRVITCAMLAGGLSTGTGAGKGIITLAHSATSGGNEIIMPLVATAAGTLGSRTNNATTDNHVTLTNLTIVAPTIALSIASVKADGVSSANVTFGSASDITTGLDTLTVITDFGTFFKGDDASAGSDVMKDATQWSPNPSVSAGQTSYVEMAATTDASEPVDTLSIRSDAVGAGTIKVYITPKGGGAAVLIKQLAITFTAATASPLLTTVALGIPSPTAIAGAGGAASTISVSLKDQNALAVAAGKKITVTTSEGVLDSNGTTCDLAGGSLDSGSDASCTYLWSGSVQSVSLWGIGNTGDAVVTVKATPFGTTTAITKTKTVTLTGGSVSTLTLGLFNSASATSAPAAYVIKNVTDTAGADFTSDEIVAIAQAQDADGNYIIPSGNVTFALTNSAGAVVNGLWKNAAEDASYLTASCSVSINATTGKCVDTIEAGAKKLKAGAVALIDNDKASTAPLAAGTYTVTATHGTGASKKTATSTFTVGAAVSTIAISDVASTTVGGTTTITATAKDAAGNLVADGTQIAISTSSANMLAKTSTGTIGSSVTVGTSNGVVTVTGLALSAGTSQVYATSGTKVGSTLSSVTGGSAAGSLDKNIPAGGSGSVYWSGGSGIVASATAGGCNALTIAGDNAAFSGKVVYVVGAAFASVNADFDALYTVGSLAKGAYELTCKSAS